jgi:hypothetical protein
MIGQNVDEQLFSPYSRSGAGQQCCYTKEGRLVVGPPGGGTIDRYHAGSSRFSTLKHLKEDVYPWYLCCRLSDSCGLYYGSRPSENGTRYDPPQIGKSYFVLTIRSEFSCLIE